MNQLYVNITKVYFKNTIYHIEHLILDELTKLLPKIGDFDQNTIDKMEEIEKIIENSELYKNLDKLICHFDILSYRDINCRLYEATKNTELRSFNENPSEYIKITFDILIDNMEDIITTIKTININNMSNFITNSKKIILFIKDEKTKLNRITTYSLNTFNNNTNVQEYINFIQVYAFKFDNYIFNNKYKYPTNIVTNTINQQRRNTQLDTHQVVSHVRSISPVRPIRDVRPVRYVSPVIRPVRTLSPVRVVSPVYDFNHLMRNRKDLAPSNDTINKFRKFNRCITNFMETVDINPSLLEVIILNFIERDTIKNNKKNVFIETLKKLVIAYNEVLIKETPINVKTLVDGIVAQFDKKGGKSSKILKDSSKIPKTLKISKSFKEIPKTLKTSKIAKKI
jgi:hypothetical protein